LEENTLDRGKEAKKALFGRVGGKHEGRGPPFDICFGVKGNRLEEEGRY